MLEYKQIGPSVGNLKKNKEILLSNLVLGKEILLLLEVCTELGKTNCSM